MSTFFSQRDHTCWPLAQSAYRCATVHEYLKKKTKIRPYLKSLKNNCPQRNGNFLFHGRKHPITETKAQTRDVVRYQQSQLFLMI